MTIKLLDSALNTCYRLGQDTRIVGLTHASAAMTIRSPLTLFDKRADKETRTHAALWQAVDYGSSIAAQLCIFPFLPKLGNYLAKNVFKYADPKAIKGTAKFTNYFAGIFLTTSILIPMFNTKFLAKIVNFVSEKFTGKKAMEKQEKEQQERLKNIQQAKKNVFLKINDIFKEVLGKNLVNDLANIVSSVKKVGNTIFKPISMTLDGVSSLLSAVIILPFNLIPGHTEQNKEARKAVKKEIKGILSFVVKMIPLAILAKKMGPLIGKTLKKLMIKENSVTPSQIIIRTVAANSLAKPLIILSNGATYMAMRKLCDELIGLSLLGLSSPVVKGLTKAGQKALKLSEKHTKGLNFALTIGIQTILMLNLFLPLISNQISGRLFKIFEKPDNSPDDLKANQKPERDQLEEDDDDDEPEIDCEEIENAEQVKQLAEIFVNTENNIGKESNPDYTRMHNIPASIALRSIKSNESEQKLFYANPFTHNQSPFSNFDSFMKSTFTIN